jgi:hypothetical protein
MTFGQLGMKAPSLAGMADAISAKISREAIHYKFSEQSVAFMGKCFNVILNEKIPGIKSLELESLAPFSKVLISDSSGWEVNPALEKAFPGCGGNASSAGCKIQVTYDLKRGAVEFCEITAGAKSDQGYIDKLVATINENELTIADLGYFSVDRFVQISEKRAFFISRFLSSTAVFNPDNMERIPLLETLKKCTGNQYQHEVLVGSGNEKARCRLICQRASEEEANQRRHALYEVSQKKGRTPAKESLDFCDWHLLITNIPELILPTEKISTLYRIRWQIELIFKQFKSVLGVHKSNTKNPHRLLCELYGKLIVAVLIHKIHGFLNAKLWRENHRELSFDKFWKRLQERSFTLMQLFFHSVQKAMSCLAKEINLIIKNCLKLKQRSRPTSLEKLLIIPSLHFKSLKI